MRGLHEEISFETEVCDALAAAGWLYRLGDAQLYDRARALFPPDLVAFVQETQPKAWEALQRTHGAAQTMSRQALDSATIRAGLKSILLGPAQLYEALRGTGPEGQAHQRG